jgi:hypothetical protein
MVVVPALRAVTIPAELTVATVMYDDVHVPPPGAAVSVVGLLIQIANVPDIADGTA